MPDEPLSRAFLDSNLWLYALIESDDPTKTATARFTLQTVQPVVSTQVINEVCVNLIRKALLPELQIRELIQSFYQKCEVVELTETILRQGSELREEYGFSFWDGLIVAAAVAANVSVLYTEDLQNGLVVDHTLRIENPLIS